jgi:predicted PurR-regulated permease PerM
MTATSALDAVVTQTEPVPAPPVADEEPRVLLHMPVDVRSAALAVLAGLAGLYTLSWARDDFIPILLGVMASYALTPVVDRLERWHAPRALASAVLLVVIIGSLGWIGYSLRDDAATLIESLPSAAQKLRRSMEQQNEPAAGPAKGGPIEKVQQAAAELEKAAQSSAPRAAAPAPRGVTKVQIEKPPFRVGDYLWSGALGLVTLAGQATVVVFLTFFLLASGNTFRRKMVRIAGPTFTEKKLTIQALDEVTDQIQRYLLVQVVLGIVVALTTWLCFLWIGVEQAAVWGIVAGILNFIPYIGAIVFTAVSAAVGVIQFGNLESAVIIAGVSLVIHTISGYVLMPWLTSRASRMNAVTVFVGVLVWGWLWGLWGLLLGVPILMIVKAVCDRVENLTPLGELLGS